MLKQGLGLVLVVLGLGVCAPAAVAAEIDLSGTYKAGQADVRISKDGEVYKVRWDYPDGSRWIGVGLLGGNVLTIGWDLPQGGNLGVAVYKVEKGEKGHNLVGRWAAYVDKRATADKIIYVSE